MALDSLPVEHLGTLTAALAPEAPVFIKGGPNGNRVILTVTSGSLVGPRINAAMPEGVAGGDWVTLRPDGTSSLDVRLCLRSDDGADLFVTYVGHNVDGVLKVAPRFETGDERYAWLNTAFTVGIGAPTPDGLGVSYELYIV